MRERSRARVLAALGALALVASACGTTAVTEANGSADVPSASRWQSQGEVDTVGSASWAVVPYPQSIQQGPDGNLRPLWILYRVTANGATEQVTPKGISTRGGLALSAISPLTAWALDGSYRYELDGAVAVTTDGGRHWSHQVVPAEVDPTPDGIAALSAERAVVVAGMGHSKSLLETTDGGADWHRLAGARTLLGAAAASCELDGVAPGASGGLWVGTSCRSGAGGLVVWRSAGGQVRRWTLGSVPTGDWADVVPGTGPDGAVLSLSWGRAKGVTEGAELFLPSPVGSPTVLGSPLSTTSSAASRVRLAPSGPGGVAAALVVQRPDAWLDQGTSEVLLDGGAWTTPSGSEAPGGAHADDLAAFPGGVAGTWLAGGSTKAGKPALWRVTLSGGALSWSPLLLAVPKTATASNLEGAGS